MSKLIIKNISKKFGTINAVNNFSIEVNDGELLAILGPSGCGKSTLLACISGLERGDRGEIHLNDRCLYSKENGINIPPEKRHMGFVFQNYALWPHMTVSKNIAFPLAMQKAKGALIKEKVQEILSLLRMEGMGSRYPGELSGGEKQRVALGRALAGNPGLLLLDEPLSNLDARLREEMQVEIRSIQRELGITVVHVTHDQEEALAMADRIALMKDGCLIQHGSPEEIYLSPKSNFAADFMGKCNIIKKGGGILTVRPEDVVVSKEKEGKESQRGIIKNRIYRGNHVIYAIESGENLIRARCHPQEKYESGEEVFVHFSRVIGQGERERGDNL